MIVELKLTKENLEAESKAVKEAKEKEVGELNKEIEKMTTDFASMLKSTLATMKQKINAANEKWESENDNAIIKRFEEYSKPNN